MSAAGTITLNTWEWTSPVRSGTQGRSPKREQAAGVEPLGHTVRRILFPGRADDPTQAPAPAARLGGSGDARRPGSGWTAKAAPATLAAGIEIEETRVEVDWQAVVRRCLNGDALAWAELVRAHHGRVYGLCYRFTGSSHDAEDLTQDVFLKVYGNLTAFDMARGSFQTWVTTMTRNLLVDHFRRSKQQRATDSIDAGWDDSETRTASDRLGMHLEDKRVNPHESAVQREIQVMVQQALTKVSPELREAVILRDLQDMDYKEIALVLRVPEGTVKSRISRGRAELARVLERSKKQVS